MRVEVEHRFPSPPFPAAGTLRSPLKPDGKPDLDWRTSLSGERWTFNVAAGLGSGDVELRLESYAVLGRPTPRHRFKVQKFWSRDDERSYRSSIRRADVPVPLSVQHEAAEKVSIIFVPWPGMDKAELGPLGGVLK